jgi:hypothetical protein
MRFTRVKNPLSIRNERFSLLAAFDNMRVTIESDIKSETSVNWDGELNSQEVTNLAAWLAPP